MSATGVSADARAFARLIEEGSVPKTDVAIYVEPTMLDVYVAEMRHVGRQISLLRHLARVAPDGGG